MKEGIKIREQMKKGFHKSQFSMLGKLQCSFVWRGRVQRGGSVHPHVLSSLNCTVHDIGRMYDSRSMKDAEVIVFVLRLISQSVYVFCSDDG